MRPYRTEVVETSEHFVRFLDWLRRRDGRYVALDTETSSADLMYRPQFRVRLIQIGDADTAWVLPWDGWGRAAAVALREYTGRILIHNSAFDMAVLARQGLPLQWHRITDTLLAMRISEPDELAGLKESANRHVAPDADLSQKDLKQAMARNGWTWDTVPLGLPVFQRYAALDVILTSRLYEAPVVQQAVTSPVWQLEMDTAALCARMADRGMRIDVGLCEARRDALLATTVAVRDRVLHEHGLDVGSPAKCARWFMDDLDAMPLMTKVTDRGAPSVDKDVLEKIMVSVPGTAASDVAKAILDVRTGEKMASAYFGKFVELADEWGMVHSQILTSEARSGRMSIRDPALQTLPKDDTIGVRAAVLPRNPDERLISSDWDQIEMRLAAIFSQDEGLLGAFREADATGGDFFTTMGASIYRDPDFKKSDPRRRIVKNACVPLDVPILTQRGWLMHDEVRVGDQTLGYDWTTDSMRWTDVLEVLHYEDAPLITLANEHLSLTATPDHRWVITNRYRNGGAPHWRHTDELGGDDVIELARPCLDSGRYAITDDDAALIGWAITDGVLRVRPLTGTTSQGSDGRRQGVLMTVQQRKHIDAVDRSLARIPHTRAERSTGVHWSIRARYARDLCRAVGLLTTDGTRPEPVGFAAGFSPSQRSAMLHAMMLADGGLPTAKSKRMHFSKADPWVISVYRTLQYLSGTPTSVTVVPPSNSEWQRHDVMRVYARRPRMTMQRVRRSDTSSAPVWCVRTGLGSWTMMQSGQPMLTGNSYGSLYGAGSAKIAATAGIPLVEAQRVLHDIFTTYPGLRTLMRRAESQAKRDGCITTMGGRRLTVPPIASYKALNYLIQGSASVLLKRTLVEMGCAGLEDLLVIPVHDEVVLSAPVDAVEDVRRLVAEIMPIHDLPLDIGAEPSEGLDRWGTLTS